MDADRLLADEQPLPDLPVGPPLGNQGQDLAFSPAQPERVGPPSTSFLGVCTYSFQPGVVAMIKDTAHRAWRIVITVGPLAAVALSLAAGMKWR